MAINYAAKYSQKVDERFKLGSLTESAVNQDYDWTGVKTVSVYSIPTVAMGDYSRTGSTRYGTASELQDVKTDYTLTRDRAFTFAIDRGNNLDQEMVKDAGKALQRQIDEVIVPEIDTYRLGVIAAAAVANSGSATAAVTSSNAYSKLLDGGVYLDENKVPAGGRIAYVAPAYYALLKQDNSFIKASDMAQGMLIKGQVGEVDGVKIVKVPSTYLPANTSFVLLHPSATVAPKKLEDYKIHDNPPGINGWLVEGRTIYDAFVLTSKVKAVYTHKTA